MDVIIIGAGAAGLMAAKKLSSAGMKVCLLEATDHFGGRIHSFQPPDFPVAMEGGAEFVHGNLEVTLSLLKEAGIPAVELAGEMWQFEDGHWKQENAFFAHAEEVINRMKSLQEDMSMSEFLEKYFSDDKYKALRNSLTSYVEGYYSGEIHRISTKSFLQEWLCEEDQQYRPEGGYAKMIQYLASECQKAGALIQLSTPVKEIRWSKGQVEVFDDRHHSYVAHKALITVSLGVWRAAGNAKAAINYLPTLPQKKEAAEKMGFGAAIKIALYFKDAFWENTEHENNKVDFKNLHMALSDLPVPTWWTQLPERSTLLTGWISGPKAEQMKNDSAEAIKEKAMLSLQTLFNINQTALKENLISWKVFNWTSEPYTLGSYSYSTMETADARKILMEPAANTLFFAGEALYSGPEMGTVEAALTSGLEVAERILERNI